MDDLEFVSHFEDCSLPSNLFDHRNHVRLAWLYLKEEPLLAALDRFRRSLKRYAGSLGASAKYHETITFAFLFLIHERMQYGAAEETFDQFAERNPELFDRILLRYYREETLASPLAREVFVMPDAVAGSGLRL